MLSQAQKIPPKITEFEIIGNTSEGLLVQKFGPKYNLVECFDKSDLSLKWARELNLKSKKSQIISMLRTGDDLLVFYFLKEGRFYNVYARKVDSKLKVKVKDILVFKTRRRFGEQSFDFKVIHDKSETWFLVQKRYKNSITPYHFDCVWLNQDLEIVDQKEFALEKLDWRFKQMIVRNDGVLYFIQGHIKRTLFSNTNLYDTIRVEEYHPISQKSRTLTIPIETELLNDFIGEWDIYNNQLAFAGFYSHKQTSDLSGYLYFSANFQQTEPTFTKKFFTPFEQDFIKKVSSNTILSPSNRLRNVEVRDFILRSDGGALLIGEIHNTGSSQSTRPFMFDDRLGNQSSVLMQYFYNDVMVFSINPDGTTHWNELLKKNQYSENDQGYFSSIGVMNSRYSINLLFNEYIARRTNLNNFRIDSEGENTISNIFDASSYKLSMAPRYAKQISPTEIIIPTFNHRNEFVLAKVKY